ncbi:Uncharacterised protein [Salmonella enterica subsp. enterica serovar Bovismorbificans]|nr:Uncharacterised protein [Salmonella enterica subsp. enterica serovar Bovismorbificans]
MQRNQRRFAVQTFAVRRVTDHRTIRAFRQWITQLRHIFHFKGDKLPDTGATGVAARPLNDARIAVGTVEMRGILRQPLTRPGLRFGFHFLPDSFVMLRPAAKSPVTTVQSRRAIGRPHRGLNQQCPRTTHRVEQRRTWLPAGTHNNRCRQRLFNWRQPGAIAITTQVQAITTEIQRNAGSFFIQPDVNTEVRRFAVHIWTRKIFPRKRIDNRVFNFHRAILTITDSVVQAAEMHRKRRARIKNLCPVYRLNAEVKIEIAVDLALTHRQDNTRGQAAPHQALVNKPRVALKMDPTLNNLTPYGAQFFQFSF